MSRDDDLPPDVARLLDAERAIEPSSKARRSRMYTRLASTVPIAPVPPDLGGTSTSIVAATKLKIVVATIGVAGAVSAGAYNHFSKPTDVPQPAASAPVTMHVGTPPRPSAQRAEPALPTPTAAPEPSVDAMPLDPPHGPASSAAAASAMPRKSDLALAEERALLKRARDALARNEPRAALAALADHRARFENGRHAEERRVLEIEALRAAGEHDRAREAARSFVHDHPDSVFRDGVEPHEPTPSSVPSAGP
ncbi:MAG: hypothetical protein HOW73_31250 [Polyangiaceae bacterium]|nr:hypothetical protein [Polyangiaceae bacterium]